MILLLLVLMFHSPQQDRILFVGDSMTAYSNGWQHQFAKQIGCQYTNLSVSGKRTSWMLQTLRSHLQTDSNYKACFIYGGINDGFAHVKTQSAIDNIQSMVDLCNSMGIEPVVIMGYNPCTAMTNLRTANADFHVNRYVQIQDMMSSLQNCKLITIADTITRQDSDDGIHFRASGHRKFSQWVLKHYSK